MVSIEDYGELETAWCPGCGNFPLRKAVKKALVASNLAPHDVLFVSGIGQAAKAPHYIRTNLFNGLHGRSLPAAIGAKLANPDLKVIAESGDGCIYGEGGNHFLACLRRNPDITLLVHDNQIYGLTKGQASPTTAEGQKTKAQPHGMPSMAFKPLTVAVGMEVNFVARGFVGKIDQLAAVIQEAIAHPGFSLVDILQPCVSFNKVNTFSWYQERCYELEADYDPYDWQSAINRVREWGDRIPVGVLYKNNRATFESHFPVLNQGSMFKRSLDTQAMEQVMYSYV